MEENCREETRRREVEVMILHSSLANIADHFRSLGWEVYTVPEAATVLFHGGVTWASMNPEQQDIFQLAIIKTMVQFEDTFVEVSGKMSVLEWLEKESVERKGDECELIPCADCEEERAWEELHCVV
jgi:hypothetical protein